MIEIKLDSKRRVTFPKLLCTALGIVPGDILRLEKRVVKGKATFCLIPKTTDKRLEWFGVFREYAIGKSHKMSDIRKSIARGVAREHGLSAKGR